MDSLSLTGSDRDANHCFAIFDDSYTVDQHIKKAFGIGMGNFVSGPINDRFFIKHNYIGGITWFKQPSVKKANPLGR